MKTTRQWFVFLFILVVAGSFLYAQDGSDDIRLFQSFFYDAPIVKNNIVEGGFQYATYDAWNSLEIGGKGNYAINEKMDFGAEINYRSWSPDEGDGQSGISDIGVYGRYHLSQNDKMNISAGAMLTLPIGSEDIWQGNLNLGGFAALRYKLDNDMVFCGTFGLLFEENWEDEYDNLIRLGIGNIYPIDEKMNLVSELVIRSEGDYMLLSSGIDMKTGNGRLRGAIGIGLDDGAPDFVIQGFYQIVLN